MKYLCVAALALSFTGAALAAEQAYQVQGTLVPFGNPLDYQTYAYMEVWGVGSLSRYAQPATDTGDTYHDLVSGSEAASALALGGFTAATASISYDPTASPYFTSASGNTARYGISPISVGLGGSAVAPFSLGSPDVALSVSRSSSAHSQSLVFGITTATVEGPLPGSSFSYSAPAGGPFTVDLVGLLGSGAYLSNGFDLSAFGSLPVRLSAPTEFRPVYIAVALNRNNASASFGVSPPAGLALSDWNGFQEIIVAYDGVFGVGVNPADFASNDAYLAASSWVTDNIRQFNVEMSVEYAITSITPVPELPASQLLLMGLLPALLLARRSIRR